MAQGPCNAPSSPHKRWSLRTWVVSEAIGGLGACQVRAARTTRCGEHATNRARRGIRVAGWPGSLPGRAARRKGAGHCALGWLVMLLAGLGACQVRPAGPTCKEASSHHPAIWSWLQIPREWALHPTWAAGCTLLRLTGRAQRRGCAGKPIPAPAVLVSLFPSSVAVSKVHFRQRANIFGCLGRRPLLAKDHGRPLAGLRRSVGPAQVGPGHIRQINSSLKSCIFINFIEQCIHSLKHAKRNIAPTHV